MPKTVFRKNEITQGTGGLLLKPVRVFVSEDEVTEKEETYKGPTAEQLREEADAFRLEWEVKKTQMLKDAETEIEELRKKAIAASDQDILRRKEAMAAQQEEAVKRTEALITEAKSQAAAIVEEAEAKREDLMAQAKADGLALGNKEGYDAGYAKGKEEADRLIERLHSMIASIFQKRDDILMDTENQIVALVLMMTEKVVKTLAENDASVLKENVLSALEKIRTKSEVILRVNTLDLKLTTEHTDDFLKAVENVSSIKVVEDSTVDKGGCIVETDFGAIDARIASQLMELEKKILELSPVRTGRR